jgi:hypothetical protein
MSVGCGRRAVRDMAGAGHEPRLSERRSIVSTLWVVVGLAAVGAVIALLASWQRGGPHGDHLGTVSTQWISEHRVGQNPDSRR